MPLDEREAVAAVVREVAGVQAEGRVPLVGLDQEALHLLLRADVAVCVRVELLLQPEFLLQRPAETVVPCRQAPPLLVVERPRLELLPRRVAAPEVRDHDEVPRAELRGQPSDVERLLPRAVPLLRPLVESREDRARRELEAARAELVLELMRIRRQVPVRPELDPHVPRGHDLVEKPSPWRLPRVVGKPDSPRIGGGADAEAVVGHPESPVVGQCDQPRSGRCRARCLTYSSRARRVLSRLETSATGTSHQPSPSGAYTRGSLLMWIA